MKVGLEKQPAEEQAGARGRSRKQQESEAEQSLGRDQKLIRRNQSRISKTIQRVPFGHHFFPLKTASDKFVRLREIYDRAVSFTTGTLAQEAASRQAEIMRMKLEDPYRRINLSRTWLIVLVERTWRWAIQAMTALTIECFDSSFLLFVASHMVIFFKEPYY
ncbi:hypothetical protein DVH24_016501 [Malus domestica]|uniref:Uncharacterized protein n=1 Tax=Malus domestica TaxID=3750 RepID=A0A498HSC2_MALDO|nr:hypothetical protein DVH24_016501 [Malus domestica]